MVPRRPRDGRKAAAAGAKAGWPRGGDDIPRREQKGRQAVGVENLGLVLAGEGGKEVSEEWPADV